MLLTFNLIRMSIMIITEPLKGETHSHFQRDKYVDYMQYFNINVGFIVLQNGESSVSVGISEAATWGGQNYRFLASPPEGSSWAPEIKLKGFWNGCRRELRNIGPLIIRLDIGGSCIVYVGTDLHHELAFQVAEVLL